MQAISFWKGPKGLCGTCYKREILLAICAYCHEKRRLHARGPGDEPTCLPCYDERFAPREPCLICAEVAVARMRGPEGEGIRGRCWLSEFRPREPCITCGNERVVARRTPEGGAVCPQCWFEERPEAKCPYCRKMKKLMHREDGDWICRACYPKFLAPKQACVECGQVDMVAKWRSEDEPLCRRCYHVIEQPKQACSDCGRVLPIVRRDPDGGGICNTCYARERRSAAGAEG
jgi:hypothetical protein